MNNRYGFVKVAAATPLVKIADCHANAEAIDKMTAEAVEEAMEEISDTDWEENCAAAIRKKYGEIPEDRGERQKLIAAMVRLGYDTDTVKEAMRTILREN